MRGPRSGCDTSKFGDSGPFGALDAFRRDRGILLQHDRARRRHHGAAPGHLIPDPYWGRNELKLRWIAERDWTLRRWVDLADPRVVLAIDGLDTVATVRVNGTVVLDTANAFRTWRVDLSDVARPGRNEIAVTIRSAPREAAARAAASRSRSPTLPRTTRSRTATWLRKVACDWGWDWNIALCPFGITGGVC
jgi:beta-mannosidase